LGISVAEVESDRYRALERLVQLTGSAVLLKGAYTLVGSPDRLPHVNTLGSRALATGGSGDVLTGLVAALAVGRDLFDAAVLAAGIHGQSGLSWEQSTGADRGLLASEIADGVPAALAQLAKGRSALTD
jgi:NAD(P)H-hydrate epimerase